MIRKAIANYKETLNNLVWLYKNDARDMVYVFEQMESNKKYMQGVVSGLFVMDCMTLEDYNKYSDEIYKILSDAREQIVY